MRIYIDRLKEGKEHIFDEMVEVSDIFDKEEVSKVIKKPLSVSFKAYLAGQELVIEWCKIQAEVCLSCTICNEIFEKPLILEGTRHIESLSDIKGAVFNPAPLVREQVLLEVPVYAECSSGCCPERETVKCYIKENHGSTT